MSFLSVDGSARWCVDYGLGAAKYPWIVAFPRLLIVYMCGVACLVL